MWTDKHRKVWRIWIYSSQLLWIQAEQEAEGISDLCLWIRNTLLWWSEGFVWMLGGFFFFYHKKGMLFSSNWQKHTPKSLGIISRSAKHVAICKAPQPPPCPHNGSASAWSSHSISAGSSTFSHHCFKTMEKSFQPGLLYKDLQCCSGLVGRECHEFFSIF